MNGQSIPENVLDREIVLARVFKAPHELVELGYQTLDKLAAHLGAD